jgi:hypothetical protein
MNKERRFALRREIQPLEVSSITTMDSLATIANKAFIVEASTNGFLLQIARNDLVPDSLRESLTLDALVGNHVVIHIRQMNLEVAGRVSRSRLIGKKSYEIGIDYTEDAPEYWRECLLDLLPAPGELE